MREALTAAVPMVAVPLFAGWPRNAAEVEEMKTKSYHPAAETLAGEMAELPAFTEILDRRIRSVTTFWL